MTFLKSLFFLLFVPGVFIGIIAVFLLFKGAYIDLWILRYLALPLWIIGSIMILWCFWDFLIKGHGTPAPMDSPKELVVTGFYKFVRNPMYVGVLFMLFSEFLWLGFWYLLAYTVFFFTAFHIFIISYEEPMLNKKFAKSYEKYLRGTPRWIPRFKTGRSIK